MHFKTYKISISLRTDPGYSKCYKINKKKKKVIGIYPMTSLNV